MNKQNRKRLGDLLLEVGIISREQLDEALEIQKKTARDWVKFLYRRDL
jgi:type IV pilus assembly protein PilB